MDISQTFTESFNALKKHKSIILPLFIYFFLVFAIMITFFYQSGMSQVIDEAQALEKKSDSQTEFDRELASWIKNEGLESILTIKNLLWFLFYAIVSGLAYIYLYSALNVMASETAKGKQPGMKRGFTKSFSFIGRLFSEKLLWFLLLAILSFLLIMLVVLAFILTPILGFILLIPAISGMIILPCLLWVKFVFVLPLIYMEDKSVISSFKQSYWITKGRFKEAAKIVGIMIGIVIMANVFTQAGLQESFVSYLTSGGLFNLLILVITIIVLAFLQSAFWSLKAVFLFKSYTEFIQEQEEYNSLPQP